MTNLTPLIYLCLVVMLLCSTLGSILCHYGRTQYHEQGLYGPKSYRFGYTTGDYANPQERHEVSDGYGHVKGWYSYKDATGKIQVIHYEAHPKHGFKVHHSKAKKHYKHYTS